MSFERCVKLGAAAGIAGGVIASSYFMGLADSSRRACRPDQLALLVVGASVAIGAPFAGAAAGAGVHQMKKFAQYLNGSSLPLKLSYGTAALAVMGAAKAYRLGQQKHER